MLTGADARTQLSKRVLTGRNHDAAEDLERQWQDFVDYGEFNRLFLEHARTSRAAGKTAEQAAADLKLPAKFSGYNLTGRGGPAGNLGIIYAELAKR